MNRHICAVLFGGVLVLLLLAGGAFGADGWWNESWQYRRAITINNIENPHDLFDYQVRVVVPRFKGMDYNFSDIRFTYKEGMTESKINYWIENFTNESAIVWVKVPFIPKTSNTTIYMYYGNPSATSESNADNTFEFFDDFEGTSLDTSKWNSNGASVSNGKCVLDGDTSNSQRGIKSKTTFPTGDIVIELYGRRTGSGDLDPAIWYYNAPINGSCYNPEGSASLGLWVTENSNRAGIYVDGTKVVDSPSEYTTTAWTRIVFRPKSGDLYARIGNTEMSGSATHSYSNQPIAVTINSVDGLDFEIDWIHVRKYTDPEPSVSIGKEQSRGFYISLMTDKANYSTGEVINLVIEVNRTQENPQVMKFRLELEDLDDKPDVLIETGSFVMPAKFHKKVVLRFAIPENPFVSSGRYAFKAYLIEPSLGEVLAYDVVYFNVTEKEAKAKEQQSEAFAAFSLVEG